MNKDDIPVTPYKVAFGCPDCDIVIKPPYLEVGYDREGNVYVLGWCEQCKSKINYSTSLLALIQKAQGLDGYVPTKH